MLDLADRLAAIAPVAGSKVFFTSGGSDSVDTAAKLARRYFHEIGQPERTVILTRSWAYHGMHAYGTAMAGIEANLVGAGGLVPDIALVAWDSADELAATIDRIGAHRIAAFFCEPVVGAGGIRFAPEGYLSRAREIVRDAGALFVSDEVITGFGRVGEWFGSTRFGLDPDLVTFAKGVTSGYVPLGGVLAAPHVAEPFWRGGVIWRHGYTYSGHTTACAAALANLEIMEREGLDTRAAQMEGPLADALSPLLAHPLVSEIRTGAGLLAAVQLDPEAIAADPSLPGPRRDGVPRGGRSDHARARRRRPADLPRARDRRSAARRAGRRLPGRARLARLGRAACRAGRPRARARRPTRCAEPGPRRRRRPRRASRARAARSASESSFSRFSLSSATTSRVRLRRRSCAPRCRSARCVRADISEAPGK